jgi:hypothetical protein
MSLKNFISVLFARRVPLAFGGASIRSASHNQAIHQYGCNAMCSERPDHGHWHGRFAGLRTNAGASWRSFVLQWHQLGIAGGQ